MDQPHGGTAAATASDAPPAQAPTEESSLPRDDDERFIVGLVLTYYRRHPQRARTRLLDLLGEVLTPPKEPAPATRAKTAMPDDPALWARSRADVAPLKQKK